MTGRCCHAIELDPAYVDVAVTRWQAFTGSAAVLEGDGRSFAESSFKQRDWRATTMSDVLERLLARRRQLQRGQPQAADPDRGDPSQVSGCSVSNQPRSGVSRQHLSAVAVSGRTHPDDEAGCSHADVHGQCLSRPALRESEGCSLSSRNRPPRARVSAEERGPLPPARPI